MIIESDARWIEFLTLYPAGDDTEKGRFSGTARADDGEDFGAFGSEGDPLENTDGLRLFPTEGNRHGLDWVDGVRKGFYS